MVVVGIWPYQHTLTLRLIASQGRTIPIYFVDEDKIMPLADAQRLVDQGYKLDETYLTLMSQEMDTLLIPYREQSFPPPMPNSVRARLQAHEAVYLKDPTGHSIAKDIEDVAER